MPPIPEKKPTAAAPADGRERLAINLFDLDRVMPDVRQMLLADKLDCSRAIWTDPDRPDEAAVAFACSLETAAAVCDIIRSHDRRAGDAPTRLYIIRARTWTKIPGHASLTKVVGDTVHLNPAVFTSQTRQQPVQALQPTRVFGYNSQK